VLRDRPLDFAARTPVAPAAAALCVLLVSIAMPGTRSIARDASPEGPRLAIAPRAGGADAPARVTAIEVVRESFWYEDGPSCAGLAHWGIPCAPRGTARRVAEATAEVVRHYTQDFPQPPPLDIVVRARAPERLGTSLQTLADVYTYGGAELVGGVVVVDVNLVAFIGETPLNDAELRSFLAHELVHAYQYGTLGPAPKNSPELWRREVAAFDWELLHMELGVRSWYRAEAIFNRDMYRSLLAGD